MKTKIFLVIIASCSLIIGLYPVIHFIIDDFGLLQTKSETLLSYNMWNINFYLHITFGGIALLIGWIQFFDKWRAQFPKLHRIIGYAYISSVFISAESGFYLAFYATGGLISTLGFASLSIIWMVTTLYSLRQIRKDAYIEHEKFMIYSFSACFAAVTLRIWLPLLVLVFGEFLIAYKIVAWLCWVPNIAVAYYIIKSKEAAANIV